MWIMVMFDLPVVEARERKAATEFRKTLLDLGFEMVQFSVYLRFCTSPTNFQTYCHLIEQALPQDGKVNILQFTDKQYERVLTFYGRQKTPPKSAPDQFDLF